MEIIVHTGQSVNIDITQQAPTIVVGRPRNVQIVVQPQNVEIKPTKNRGMAFQFVQNVLGVSDVVRCTLDQFQALTHLDGKTWYVVTTTSDELRYLYLGSTLIIARAIDDGGTCGFPYTFPIIFGR